MHLNAVRKTDIPFNQEYREAFLVRHGWSIVSTVGQDSSIRRYFRLRKNEQTAILMETVPDHSKHATPGHSIAAFIKISKWLNSIGAKAPDIYEADEDAGLLILEDFGGICFKYAAQSGEDPELLYNVANETLEHIATKNCTVELPKYYESHVHRRHRRVVEYYMPLARGIQNEKGVLEAYQAAWREIEKSLAACPQSFIHVDYHAENLMWLPDERGIKRCGILDFQGAMIGPAPYDLANLLEDARSDVPLELKRSILAQYDRDFCDWFRVLATQFHCRVIGQFLKQAAIDNNAQYLTHIPRLENYLSEAMKDELLSPLKQFFDDLGVHFNGYDLNHAPLISADAE